MDVLPKREGRFAFTLVEVLAVVAIIAVLATLMVPFAKSGIRKSMAAKGMSNLRQLAQAQIQFAGEHNGVYTTPWSKAGDLVWQAQLIPYLNINHDPTDNAFIKNLRMDPQSVLNVPDSAPLAKRASWAASVGLNPWMVKMGSGSSSSQWNSGTIVVPKPSQIILLGEMPVEFNGEGTWPPDWNARKYSSFDRGGRRQMLMAFCDGHVAAIEMASLHDAVSARPPGEPNLWHWWYQPGVGVTNWE